MDERTEKEEDGRTYYDTLHHPVKGKKRKKKKKRVDKRE